MIKRKRQYKEKNRRLKNIFWGVLLLILAWILYAKSGFDSDIRVVLSEKQKEQIKNSREWKEIFENAESYPNVLLKDLERNPEMLGFVKGYTKEHRETSELTIREKLTKHPLFLQWDARWGYEPYGQSVIGVSGCGPTCMSMVIYSMTRDKEATPNILAAKAMEEGYYVEGIGTSWSFMEKIGRDYGVIVTQFSKLEQWEIEDRLDDGNLIICAMGPGDFTDQGHFIVIYDYSNEGFSVNDPFSYTNSCKKWQYVTLFSQCQQLWVCAV